MHERVEARALLQQEVDAAHDAEDAEAEDPHAHHGHDAGPAADEEAEQAEEGGQQVHDEDGARQLPRRDRGPEGPVGARDEDEPVLRERDLEEEDLVDGAEVLHDAPRNEAVVADAAREHGGQRDPGAHGQHDAQDDGHAPEARQVPLDRLAVEGCVVVGDGQRGDVGEDGDEDDELQVERLVEDDDPQAEEDLQVQRQRDTVDDVGVHAVEDLPRRLERVDDGGQTGREEHDVGGGASGVRGALDGNARVGLLERGRVVDAVARHGHEVAALLQNLDHVVLVLREDLGEAVGRLDEVVHLGAGHVAAAGETELLGVVHIGAEAELAGGLARDADGVAGQHLDRQAERLGLVDGLGGVVARRIHAGHDAEDLPRALAALARDAERAVAARGEVGDLVLVGRVDLLGDRVVCGDGRQHEERRALDAGDALALR